MATDNLRKLLKRRNAAELRAHGLGIDAAGRIVSIYEARASAQRELDASDVDAMAPWPVRARWAKLLADDAADATRRRFPRGSAPPPFPAAHVLEDAATESAATARVVFSGHRSYWELQRAREKER